MGTSMTLELCEIKKARSSLLQTACLILKCQTRFPQQRSAVIQAANKHDYTCFLSCTVIAQMVQPDGTSVTLPPSPSRFKAALLCTAFRAGAEVCIYTLGSDHVMLRKGLGTQLPGESSRVGVSLCNRIPSVLTVI